MIEDDAPDPEEEAERMSQRAAQRAAQERSAPKKQIVATVEAVITKVVRAEGVEYRVTTQESDFHGTGETPQLAWADYGEKAHRRRGLSQDDE